MVHDGEHCRRVCSGARRHAMSVMVQSKFIKIKTKNGLTYSANLFSHLCPERAEAVLLKHVLTSDKSISIVGIQCISVNISLLLA